MEKFDALFNALKSHFFACELFQIGCSEQLKKSLYNFSKIISVTSLLWNSIETIISYIYCVLASFIHEYWVYNLLHVPCDCRVYLRRALVTCNMECQSKWSPCLIHCPELQQSQDHPPIISYTYQIKIRANAL